LVAIIEDLQLHDPSYIEDLKASNKKLCEQRRDAVELAVKYKKAIVEHKENVRANKSADAGVFIAGDKRLWSVLELRLVPIVE